MASSATIASSNHRRQTVPSKGRVVKMTRLSVGLAALSALPCALAFQNASPLFLFSTANLDIPNHVTSLETATVVTNQVLQALERCDTKNYIVIKQKGVFPEDFIDTRSSPRLSRFMSGKHEDIKTRYVIPEVVDTIDISRIVEHLQANCGHKAGMVINDAPSADQTRRMTDLQANDEALEERIADQAQLKDFTVIYITTPPETWQVGTQEREENPPYEMQSSFGGSVQMELKRDLSSHTTQANSTSRGGLFERYQYFTPGIFMAFSAIIPLFLILLVGIRALTSLEVSYFAFSKEMGPNAQKKQ